VLGLGLTGCLCLGVSLAFLAAFWVEVWAFPLFLVSTIFRVREEVDEGLRFVMEMLILMNLDWLWMMMKVYGVGLVIRR